MPQVVFGAQNDSQVVFKLLVALARRLNGRIATHVHQWQNERETLLAGAVRLG
jgi:uncharacterized membrane protein YciS (DUF1049 family)